MCVRSSGSENSRVVPKKCISTRKSISSTNKLPSWAYSMFALDLKVAEGKALKQLFNKLCFVLQ